MASLDARSIRRIDRQRFHDMLNMLPPVSWVRIGNHAESFKISEHVCGGIARMFCRIGLDHFELTGDTRSSHHALIERCRAFLPLDAQPPTAVMDKAHV